MNAKRKTSAMLALLMALGVTNVVRGDDFETIRRFPKPTPLPASTTRVGTDKDVAYNALHHKFSDMVGKPDRKGSIHFNGHPAEIAALTLDKLGLMNGYPDGTFRPDRTITRAEFAAVVSRAFKFAGSSAAAAFSDPDGPLMETEAVKMVVAALGYADDAAAKGGYPRGYMRVGNEKYISRGLNVHIGEQATRGLAAQIMFYALGAQIKGTGKTLYNMHAGRAGKRIGREFIDAMLQDYYYYRGILGVCRATDWLAERPEVDATRFVYQGASQGGGLGLAATALSPRFTKALLMVPALSDVLAFRAGRRSGCAPCPVQDQPPEDRARAEALAPYFDGANFASRIRCPVRVLVGFADDACVPCAVCATYNEMTAPDRGIVCGIGMGHDGNTRPDLLRILSEWLRAP